MDGVCYQSLIIDERTRDQRYSIVREVKRGINGVQGRVYRAMILSYERLVSHRNDLSTISQSKKRPGMTETPG